jgi:hypothetical protein
LAGQDAPLPTRQQFQASFVKLFVGDNSSAEAVSLESVLEAKATKEALHEDVRTYCAGR